MGANVNDRNVQGNTPLLTALTHGNLDCVKMLVQAGATLDSSSGEGVHSLIKSVSVGNTELLQCLLEAGINPDFTRAGDNTALMIAAQNGHVDCLQLLLSSGAKVNIHNTSQETALTLAASSGQAECIEWLVDAGADINWRNKHGETPLMLAVRSQSIRQDKKGYTALIKACNEPNVLCVERLLKNEADVNIRDLTGKTALMHTAMTSNERTQDEITDLLLERGADVNVQDNDGTSVLMLATRRNLGFMFNRLICNGADLELTDNKGRTLLVQVLQKWHSGKCRQFLLPLLKRNVNPCLSPEFRPLLERVIPRLDVKFLGCCFRDLHFIRFCVSNGFTDFRLGTSNLSVDTEENLSLDTDTLCPLTNVLSNNIFFVVERYMVACCFVFLKDFQVLRRMKVLKSLNEKSRQFVLEAGTQPWPLVKLSLIKVSSLIGQSPGREDRIRQTGLPWPVQDCLLFQRPISCLPVHHWKDIPLCFNPTEYDRLPASRPLLYNWPFGRRLVKCDCRKCMGKGLNFCK